MKPILLIALGGNAFIKPGETGTAEEQFHNLQIATQQIARLSRDYRIIITHGNGPQVGNLLLQQECCVDTPRMPLEVLVAQTQGQLGYMIESSLDQSLMAQGIEYRPLITLITYVVVDENDPGFNNPIKPIGPAYSREKAVNLPWRMQETPKGWRRVVASPKPVTIIEHREIKDLIEKDYIIICCGGGGIPVIRHGREFQGVDAVIDKDLVSALLAGIVQAESFIIATDIDGAMLNFNRPDQERLNVIHPEETRRYIDQGHFSPGSMLPKMEAALQFVESGGKRGIITSLEKFEEAILNTDCGTQIIGNRNRI